MKPIFKTLLLGAFFISVCAACSSDDEPSWKSWDEELEVNPDDESYVYPELRSTVDGVVIGGEVKPWTPEIEAALREEVAQPAKHPVEVRLSSAGTIKNAIGQDALEMDALTVSGPLDSSDLRYIKLCVCSGKLRSVDLSGATLKDNTLPEQAFFANEYGKFVHVPLLKLVLPDNIKKLDRSCLFNTLITEIKLSDNVEFAGWSLANTPMLGGELTIGEALKPAGMIINDIPFFNTGDGSLVINYKRKIADIPVDDLRFKELNLVEGVVEELPPYALIDLPLETLTLPKSLKKIDFGALQNLSNLKTLYINFTDASVLGFTWEELYEKEKDPDFNLDLWCKSFPLLGVPLDATIYVPKGAKEALYKSVALDGCNLVEVD